MRNLVNACTCKRAFAHASVHACAGLRACGARSRACALGIPHGLRAGGSMRVEDRRRPVGLRSTEPGDSHGDRSQGRNPCTHSAGYADVRLRGGQRARGRAGARTAAGARGGARSQRGARTPRRGHTAPGSPPTPATQRITTCLGATQRYHSVTRQRRSPVERASASVGKSERLNQTAARKRKSHEKHKNVFFLDPHFGRKGGRPRMEYQP